MLRMLVIVWGGANECEFNKREGGVCFRIYKVVGVNAWVENARNGILQPRAILKTWAAIAGMMGRQPTHPEVLGTRSIQFPLKFPEAPTNDTRIMFNNL